MMAIETIRSMSAQAARKAARDHKKPFIVEQEDIDGWREALQAGRAPQFPFPNLGDYRPKGWKLEDHFMCDSSGFGADDEPAKTPRQLVEALVPGKGYGIIEVGQFQVFLGVFSRREEQSLAE